MRASRILLDRSIFPVRTVAAEAIRTAYRDMVPLFLGASEHVWLFELRPQLAARPLRDPLLEKIAAEMLSVDRAGLATFRSIQRLGEIPFWLVLQHTWALEAFSHWLARDRPRDQLPTIVHIDAHDDLQPPALFLTEQTGVFRIPIGGDLVDLYSPETVSRAIEGGHVGIGGFQVPFLHALGGGKIVHLHRAPLSPARLERRALVREPFNVLGVGGHRPALGKTGEPGEVDVVTTTDPTDLQRHLADGPVLLDLDLDYFANVFDDTLPRPGPIPQTSDALADVCKLVSALEVALGCARIELITIALSPEFFPAALWTEVLPPLWAGLERIVSQ